VPGSLPCGAVSGAAATPPHDIQSSESLAGTRMHAVSPHAGHVSSSSGANQA
jgi:hypothetical protein